MVIALCRRIGWERTYRSAVHKGFYNDDDFSDELIKIRYTDFFEYPDDEDFPYDSAHSLLRGSCNHFALSLQKKLDYNPYIIHEKNGVGFHVFCQIQKGRTLYYVDARGITSSFDEFMTVAREFVRGEYIIRPVSQEDIDDWAKDSNYDEEAFEFAEAVIEKYRECYTL